MERRERSEGHHNPSSGWSGPMSRIADLAQEIQAVTEAVARAERTAALYPQYPSAFVTVRSLEKMRNGLSETFRQEVARLGVRACSYRIDFPKTQQPAIRGVTSSVGLFQEIFTNVYHALKNGARKRARVSLASLEATRLNFAFTFPGSVGFMMTIEDEQQLFLESDLSVAMSKTLQLISAPNAEKLDELTEVTGLPAIRLAHQWAVENAKFDFGADIKWRVEQDDAIAIQVQPVEVRRLSGMLSQYIAKERVIEIAELRHLNMFDQTFEMILDGKRITGTFDNAISAANPASVPRTYTAHLTVATRIAPTENSDGVTYYLERLENYDPNSQSLFQPKR